MRLTIIGCSGSMAGSASPASAYLIQANGVDEQGHPREYSVIMDFGSGAMGYLLRYVDPAIIDAIMISHFHIDHCGDIIGMQVYRKWLPAGPLPQIPLYTPGDGQERMRQLDGGEDDSNFTDVYDFVTVMPGDSFDIGPIHVEAFEARHTIDALCYRITAPSENDPEKTVTLTFSGDTDTCQGLLDASIGADVLLCEAAYEDGRDTVRGVHLTGSRAGKLAKDAGVSSLFLTHLPPWTDPHRVKKAASEEYDGPIFVVKAGDAYKI
ncbi:MBL fold metallo-hydrolase [Actinotignum urinale]|uniref:MBL fold metallo-hydrolase n=1 Tax=Actinotignum urinale TaxID=190146 RepID=UPI0003B65FAF|nr:MBL fold metallo-hydrolase [Actinotignum urinale]MDY5159984.1 MBL fold metallo-hydrolase [Actinotignum urinale]WIK58788.1 MBL fold metallo-hydrolase [Actinotignum urinale]